MVLHFHDPHFQVQRHDVSYSMYARLSFLYLHFIFDLHFVVVVLHFISRFLFHVTGTRPWLLRPVNASTSSPVKASTSSEL